MKKGFYENRIAILSVLAGIVYVFLIFSSFFSASESFLLGWHMGDEKTEVHTKDGVLEVRNVYSMDVNPRGGVLDFPEHASGEGDTIYPARFSSIKIPLTKDFDVPGELRKYETILWFILFFVIVLYVILPFRFFALLGDLKKNDVFTRYNLNCIRQIGWILIILYILEWGVNIVDYNVNQVLFELSDYTISFQFADSLLLLLGVVVLLVGEILARGVSMKEEQQLTI